MGFPCVILAVKIWSVVEQPCRRYMHHSIYNRSNDDANFLISISQIKSCKANLDRELEWKLFKVSDHATIISRHTFMCPFDSFLAIHSAVEYAKTQMANQALPDIKGKVTKFFDVNFELKR